MTAIEWTDVTWNPTTGCDRVTPGCDNCYALTMAKRLKGMGSAKYQRDGDPRTSGPGFGITEHATALDAPLHWRKPVKVFVNSMSDLFHAGVTDDFIARVFAVMAATPKHTYQVLTKRHGRMRSLLSSPSFREHVSDKFGAQFDTDNAMPWPLPNVWMGVSVEDQQRADLRIPALLETPAAVRFLSCEPLLGPVDLGNVDCGGCALDEPCVLDNGVLDNGALARIGWVIAGGESGPGARPMHPDWARDLRDQCNRSEVPFLFKQWGDWVEANGATGYVTTDGVLHELDATGIGGGNPVAIRSLGKAGAGRDLDGRTWDEYPAVSA